MKQIDAEALIAEIDRLRKEINTEYHGLVHNREQKIGFIDSLDHILSFINLMQEEKTDKVDYNRLKTELDNALQKETKESWNKFLDTECVSEDLESASKQYVEDNPPYVSEFTHESEIEGIYNDVKQTFIAGANWQKEQMLKDVIEGEIQSGGTFIPLISIKDKNKLKDFKFGDIVKILIIKKN